jgi:DNA-binding response OmpR family regulator
VRLIRRQAAVAQLRNELAANVTHELKTEGYDVRTAQNGQKGLEARRHDPPDLLLPDWMLPKVNGCAIRRPARARPLDWPIIMQLMVTDRCVDQCVTTLRAKIKDDPRNPAFIRTLGDIGCHFEAPP